MTEKEFEKEIINLIDLFNRKQFKNVISIGLNLFHTHKDKAILPNLIGASYSNINDHDKAEKFYKISLKLEPNNYETLSNLGKVKLTLGAFDEAIKIFTESLKYKSDNPDVFLHLGISYYEVNNYNKSIELYNKAILLDPNFSQCYYNLGLVYSKLGNFKNAIKSYKKAIDVNPNYFKALNSLAVEYINKNDYESAIIELEKALSIYKNYANAFNNLGVSYLGLKKHQLALKNFSKAYLLDNNLLMAGIQKFYLKKRICDWTENLELNKILNRTISEEIEVSPWQCLAMEDDPKNHYIRAKKFSEKFRLLKKNNIDYKNKKIKIGYYASDFHHHPGMINMAGLFENHNKDQFDIYGFYYGNIKKDKMHFRIKKNFKEFFYVDQMNDEEIAELSKKNKIDIAIYRAGLTANARSSIFSHKVAPIQINFLAYPGTTGQEGVDYIISDNFVIPKEHEKYYSENIIFLNKCYYPRDNTRTISNKKFHREDYNIPEEAFVFCSFNNTYKISQQEFNIWMKILKNVKNGILLLLTNNNEMKKNIIKEAEKQHIEKDRIKFIEYINFEDHLSRHSIADLFLDCFNYNAHTSCVDALWTGLPVLTKVGNSFSSRICGSLLNYFNLTELVTYSELEYMNKAIELSENKKILSSIKSKILEAKNNNTYFNTKKYTQNLEKAYKKIHEMRIKENKIDNVYITNE